jgi:hypothetical protein
MSKDVEKILALKEKKYRWEALKRSEIFQKELIEIYRQFLIKKKWPDKRMSVKLFLREPEIKTLSQKYNVDSHCPFIEILINENDKTTWRPKRIDSYVELIRQVSGSVFPIKLAVKDNCMIVKIDIRKPRGQILLEIESLLKKYGKELKKNTKKPSYDLNDFSIFDMNKGLSPWKITQRLYPEIIGKSYRPDANNYDLEARRLHKNICDAIARAKSAIASIQ